MSEPDPTGTSETPVSTSAEPNAPKTRFGNEDIAPYFFVVLFALAFFAVGYVLLPFFGDMVIAFLFVILLTPLHARLTRLLGERQVLAAGLMVVALVVVGSVPIFLVASALLRDISEAAVTWGSAGRSLALRAIAGRNGVIMSGISTIAARLGSTLAPEWVEQALLDTGRSLTQYLSTRANAFLSSLLSTTLHVVISLFATPPPTCPAPPARTWPPVLVAPPALDWPPVLGLPPVPRAPPVFEKPPVLAAPPALNVVPAAGLPPVFIAPPEPVV